MPADLLPWEFWKSASKMSLQDMYLIKLQEASRWWKEGQMLSRRGNEAMAEALFIQCVIEHKEELLELCSTGTLQVGFDFGALVPANSLPRHGSTERGMAEPANDGRQLNERKAV